MGSGSLPRTEVGWKEAYIHADRIAGWWPSGTVLELTSSIDEVWASSGVQLDER